MHATATSHKSFEALRKDFHAIGEAHIALAASPELKLALRMHLAEQLFMAAIRHKLPHQQLTTFLEAVEQLGFRDLPTRISIYKVYASGMFTLGKKKEAIKILEHLKTELGHHTPPPNYLSEVLNEIDQQLAHMSL